MNKILQLLEIESLEIESSFKKASIEGRGTPQEVSDRREAKLSEFIRKYFPFPFRVTKGQIIDSYGNESASIDCILLNANHPYTTGNGQQFSAILSDGVDVAIELKPDLSSDTEIERSLKQIESVKKLKRVHTSIIPTVGKTKIYIKEANRRIPAIIFSTETYKDIDLLLKKITEYYVKNEIPRILQFDLIVVNNRCVIVNSSLVNYSSVEYDGLIVLKTERYTLAFLLMELNKYPKSISNFNMSKTVLSHYIKSDLFNAIEIIESPYNHQLKVLPNFDIDINMDEVERWS